MCGVVGILNGRGTAAELQQQLAGMLAQQQHRGPDGWGRQLLPGVALGHVRLSIIDLSAGHQPMSDDRFVISYNGEVFNHVELRAELESLGQRFITHSDTEVILKAVDQWDLDAFRRFNGQFALLLWDRREQRLIVARDRYGVRPLYVLDHDGSRHFSSELKSFDVLPGFARRFEPEHLLEHALFWNTLGERTVYRGVREVQAGTCEVHRLDHSVRVVRFHQLGERAPDVPPSFEDAKAELRARLTNAVRLRLRSDVPVGNYLSGGVDSSVITWLTDELRSDTFQTFSVAFEDPAFDESHFQQLMNVHLDATNHTERISHGDVARDFEQAVWHAERPLFRTAPVPLLRLSRAVRAKGIRVVLTGEAADEVLWGYDVFKEVKLLQFWARHPDSKLRPQLIKRLYPHLAHYQDDKHFGLMRMFYEGFLGSYSSDLVGLAIRVHNNRIVASYMEPSLGQPLSDEWVHSRLHGQLPDDWPRWSLYQREQFLEMRTLLQGYLLSSQGDRMSLANGIEGRYPFLDPDVVEWAFHLPLRYKLPGFSQKHLLRQAFAREVPRQIIDRPKQPYQAPDLASFVRDGRLVDAVAHFLEPAALQDVGLFEPRLVARLLAKLGRAGSQPAGYRDNMLICFLLSTQMAAMHARTPRALRLDPALCTVDRVEGC